MRIVGTYGTRPLICFVRLTLRHHSPEDLGLLAESAWFAGDPDAAIEARERAHAGYLEQDDKCQAAAMALELGLDHFERLEAAIGNGWLGRAKRLLEQTPKECAAHGWQALSLAYLARRLAGSEEEALRQARLAQGIGERLAIPAIQALALQQQGYALVAMVASTTVWPSSTSPPWRQSAESSTR